jgi:hypothetical protein
MPPATELFDNHVSTNSFANPIRLFTAQARRGEFSEFFQSIGITCEKYLSQAQQRGVVGAKFPEGSSALFRRILLQSIRKNLF